MNQQLRDLRNKYSKGDVYVEMKIDMYILEHPQADSQEISEYLEKVFLPEYRKSYFSIKGKY